MNTTGKQLVDHWTWAAEKGLMNANSARAVRAACAQVLGVLDNWEQTDVASIDVDDAIRRFQNLRARDFNPESLQAYERRFRSAVDSFLAYVKDPATWRPAMRPAKTPNEQTGREKTRRSIRSTERHDETPGPSDGIPSVALIEYPFPLREGVVARLKLPRDISLAEAKRLHGFMIALAIDSTPKE